MYYNEDAAWLLEDAEAEPKQTATTDADKPPSTTLAIEQKLEELVEERGLHSIQEEVPVYALQFYQGYERQRALDVVEGVRRRLKENTYTVGMHYRQPYYIVRVRYFFSPLEAHRFKTRINAAFPQAILIPMQVKRGDLLSTKDAPGGDAHNAR